MDARFDDLLARSGWIRDLARRLAADVHQAEDLAQDAWVAALSRPPARTVSMRGWMARVLRNRAFEERRQGAARREREGTAARREPEPSTDELVERLDLHRQIADAVRALDEPYRSAILLRYFEGRTSKEIARQSGEPVRTVHSRLNRGLGLLRQRLQPRDESARGAWLAGLIALGDGSRAPIPAGISAGASTGALLMTLKTKAAIAITVLAGLAAVRHAWREPNVPSVAPAELASEPALANERTVAPLEDEARAAAMPEPDEVEGASTGLAQGEPRATAAFPTPLRGRVIDLQGVGVAGVPVVFAPFGHPGRGEPVTSGPDGTFVIDDPPESGQIDAVGGEWATVFQPRVIGWTSEEPVLVVAPAIALAGWVLDGAGAPVAGARVSIEPPGGLRAGLGAVVVDESHTRDWSFLTDRTGRFEWAAAPAIARARLEAAHPDFEDAGIDLPGRDALDVELVLGAGERTRARLSGRVVDAEGNGLAASLVLGEDTADADDAGWFELSCERDSEARTLRATAEGFLPSGITGAPGAELEHAFPDPLIVTLAAPALELRGRVVDADGHPVPDVAVWTPDEQVFGSFAWDPDDPESPAFERTVESIARDDPWNDEVRTDDDGRFRLRGLADRPYTLYAFDENELRCARAEPVRPGRPGEHVELELPAAAARVEATGRLTSLAGTPIGGVEVRFGTRLDVVGQFGSHADDRWGVEVETEADGRFRALVPRRTTRVSFDGGGLARDVQRTIDLEREAHLELALPLRCRLQVVLPDTLRATSLQLLDPDGERLAVSQKHGWIEYQRYDVDLRDGRSEVLRTSELATTLVLFDGDDEVLRMPLALDPSDLTTVRP